MRQDAFRSLEHQEMAVIPQWIAGHAEVGSMAQLDRALGRWLAKQAPERNQRVGYARKGVFTLSQPMTEERAQEISKKRNNQRAAKRFGLNAETPEQYAIERAAFEEKRIAAIKAKKDAEIARRIAALPERIVEAYDLRRVKHRNWGQMSRAEWVATLSPEEQDHVLTKREFAKQAAAARSNECFKAGEFLSFP